jgi:hypothetical protein
MCGGCNVCCVVPRIDEPALQKLPGCRCRNALSNGECAIYEMRPQTCRSFFCGWRLLSWVDARLRPDRSGVFIRLTEDEGLLSGSRRFALMVTVLNHEGLNASGNSAKPPSARTRYNKALLEGRYSEALTKLHETRQIVLASANQV